MVSESEALLKEIRAIRAAFRRLAWVFARVQPVLEAAGATNAVGGKGSRRRHRLSSRQQAMLKLQGRYIGSLRALKPRERAKVKRIRVEKGFRAAISEAHKLARG